MLKAKQLEEIKVKLEYSRDEILWRVVDGETMELAKRVAELM